MRIRQVIIRNFGQFHNREFSFSPGLNVVYGGNESGKSTLHTFLISMLFGMEKDSYSQYKPWNSTGFYAGEMDFEAGNKVFHLERNFYHGEKRAEILDMQSGEILSEENGDLQMCLGGMTREMYQGTCCILQREALPKGEWVELMQNFMAGTSNVGEDNIQGRRAIQYLKSCKENVEKEMKRKLEERGHQLEKLQLEREILERDVERLRHEKRKQEEQPEKKGRFYLWILVAGCFLAAGCFLSAALWDFPVRTTIIEGMLICISIAFLAVTVYRADKNTARAPVEREEQLREKQTRLFNILEYQTELEMPTEAEKELKRTIAAYEIAGRTICSLTGEIYEDFESRMNEGASRILAELTQEKYERVDVNEKKEISVYSNNRICRLDQLSGRTLEQIYFALRMSLGEIFSQKEPMPILLDETFLGYDESRMSGALQWLGRQKRQVILFTCQKREMEYLEKMGIVYQKIELEGN